MSERMNEPSFISYLMARTTKSARRRIVLMFFAIVPWLSLHILLTPRTSPPPTVWTGCENCCESAAAVIQQKIDAPPNLICFDRSHRLYTAVTPFQPAFYYYLGLAQKFLDDLPSDPQTLRKRIVWRIEDDATVPDNLLTELHSAGVATFGHSVDVSKTTVKSYTAIVPNFHFIEDTGFRNVISRINKHAKPFLARSQRVFWTGATTGHPCNGALNCEKTCEDVARVKLVRSARGVPWLNCSLTKASQWCASSEEELRSSKLLSHYIAEHEWIRNRGLIDIDGNVDAWGLSWRLQSGSVVFIVESSYANFFSRYLVDGVHYFSISRDLSNLRDKTSIIQSNDTKIIQKLSKMADSSRLLMEGLNYASTLTDVARALQGTSPRSLGFFMKVFAFKGDFVSLKTPDTFKLPRN